MVKKIKIALGAIILICAAALAVSFILKSGETTNPPEGDGASKTTVLNEKELVDGVVEKNIKLDYDINRSKTLVVAQDRILSVGYNRISLKETTPCAAMSCYSFEGNNLLKKNFNEIGESKLYDGAFKDGIYYMCGYKGFSKEGLLMAVDEKGETHFVSSYKIKEDIQVSIEFIGLSLCEDGIIVGAYGENPLLFSPESTPFMILKYSYNGELLWKKEATVEGFPKNGRFFELEDGYCLSAEVYNDLDDKTGSVIVFFDENADYVKTVNMTEKEYIYTVTDIIQKGDKIYVSACGDFTGVKKALSKEEVYKMDSCALIVINKDTLQVENSNSVFDNYGAFSNELFEIDGKIYQRAILYTDIENTSEESWESRPVKENFLIEYSDSGEEKDRYKLSTFESGACLFSSKLYTFSNKKTE